MLVAASSVLAQDLTNNTELVAIATPASSEGLRETYDEFPNTSGSSLVGLRFGRPSGRLIIDAIYLTLPGSDVDVICVRAVTQDARYFALNSYRIQEVPEGSRSVRLQPLTEGHEEDLSDYSAEDFAVRAYVPSDKRCRATGAVFLPQVGSNSDTLTVYVNGNSRTAVAELFQQIVNEETVGVLPVSTAHCIEAGTGARIAFDLKCHIPLDRGKLGSEAYLRLIFNDGFGEERQVYKILLLGGSN